jgi:precorrin-8X/cobalt-precorrin-8 methylmutase
MRTSKASRRWAIIIMSKASAPMPTMTMHTIIMATRIRMITTPHQNPADAMAERAPGLNLPCYQREPAAILAESFALIRREADLSHLPASAAPIALRMIHACGMTDLPADLAITADAALAGRQALQAGAALLTDVAMVAQGIARRRLPAGNPIHCFLDQPDIEASARLEGITRSAAAVTLWPPYLAGAIVLIGNAPTALFRLLEGLAAGWPRPALVIATPPGFIGAAESKEALIAAPFGLPSVVLRGRRGGSALAAAALNALLEQDCQP